MSKEDKRKEDLYVLNADGVREVFDHDKNSNVLKKLKQTKEEDRYISGKITGIEMLSEDGPVIASLFIGDYRVIIPFEVFVNEEIIENTRNLEESKYIMKRRLGSYIDFKIVAIDEENKVVVGDRVAAMEQKKESFWYRKNVDSDSYMINPGSLVEVRVVTVAKQWMIVEVLGIETRLFAQDISHVRISDLSKKYAAGDDLVAKVLSVKRDGEDVDIKISIRDVVKNPIIDKINRFNIDDIYIGVVSMIDKFGVYVEIDGGVEILCKLPKKEKAPIVGSTVTVLISNINKEQYRLFGIITDVSSII